MNVAGILTILPNIYIEISKSLVNFVQLIVLASPDTMLVLYCSVLYSVNVKVTMLKIAKVFLDFFYNLIKQPHIVTSAILHKKIRYIRYNIIGNKSVIYNS